MVGGVAVSISGRAVPPRKLAIDSPAALESLQPARQRPSKACDSPAANPLTRGQPAHPRPTHSPAARSRRAPQVGGILVALVIKYADGLAKNLATASSIVLTTAASHFLFGAPMSTSIVLGSLIVIISGYNYQTVQ